MSCLRNCSSTNSGHGNGELCPWRNKNSARFVCGFALVDKLVDELFPGKQEGADGSRQISDLRTEKLIFQRIYLTCRGQMLFLWASMSQTSHLLNFTSVCPASRPNPSDPVTYKGQESQQPAAGIPSRLFQEPSGFWMPPHDFWEARLPARSAER